MTSRKLTGSKFGSFTHGRQLRVEPLEDRRLLVVATFIGDLNATAATLSGVFQAVTAGDRLFFGASDDAHGRELWTSDGTTAGTRMVSDLVPGSQGSGPSHLTPVGEMVFFATEGTSRFLQLWRSDGTTEGTFALGSISVTAGADRMLPLTVMGSTIYFSGHVDGGAYHTAELWKSDGTSAGTQLVKEIRPGTPGSLPSGLHVLNDKLYFSANDGVVGAELWVSDGTAEGTTLVKDLGSAAGTRSGGTYPSWLTSMDSILYFNANDGTNGNELWRSDGTAAGTYMIRATPSYTFETGPAYLTPINGLLYYSMHDRDHGRELWRSDGTAAGTYLFRDLNPGSYSSSPKRFTEFEDGLFFAAEEPSLGEELWRTDFASEGVTFVKELFPGTHTECDYEYGCYQVSNSSAPRNFIRFNGELYFLAGGKIWKTDGTSDGTVSAVDAANGAFLVDFKDQLFFANASVNSPHSDLWRSDGTQAGTVRVGRPGTAPSAPDGFLQIGDAVYFAADDGIHGREIWRADASTGATQLAQDLVPGPAGSNPVLLDEVNGRLIFSSNSGLQSLHLASGATENLPVSLHWSEQLHKFNGVAYFAGRDEHGTELWRTDGTAAGTVLVKDLRPGEEYDCWYVGYEEYECAYVPYSGYPTNFTEYKGQLFFTSGSELWTTNGTDAGTNRIPDFPAYAYNLVVVEDYIYFSSNGSELWRTSGVAAGTSRVMEGSALGLSEIRDVTPFRDGMLFVGWNNTLGQSELWFSEGTARTSTRLTQFAADYQSSLRNLQVLGDRALFTPLNSLVELWSTDGTAAGTIRLLTGELSETATGQWTASPWQGKLVFSATDAAHGTELWLSDGTIAGTELLVDLIPGSPSSLPRNLTALGDALWFSVDDGVLGREPWRLIETVPDTIPPQVTGLFSAGAPIAADQELRHVVTDLTLVLSENMSNGVSDPSNWLLARNGVDVSHQINALDFAFNSTEERYEATVALSTALTNGAYTLTLRDDVTDMAGNRLDGDGDGQAGGDFSISFSILAPLPAGDEFRVNTFTAGDQRGFPTSPGQIAMAADGGFIVTWSSVGQEGTGDEIYFQRYDRLGQRLGAETRANSITTGNQRNSTITAAANGSFVITWNDDHNVATGFDIYARRFDALGAPQGDEFLVNATNTAGAQRSPVVTSSPDGRFAVVWHGPDANSNGVYARMYAADSTALTAEFPISVTTAGQQQIKAGAMSAAGHLIVVWQSDGQDGDQGGIYARLFDNDTTPLTGELLVSQTASGNQQNPTVASDASGNFLVTWTSDGQDGDSGGIYARRFDIDGQPLTDEFRVNETTAGAQRYSTVAMDADGDVLITWSSSGQDGDGDGIYARRYNAAGQAEGHEFRVNSFTPGNQVYSSPALDEDGDFVVVWSSQGQDGSGYGVYGQRFAIPGPHQPGDTNDDGAVDIVDLNNVRNYFGATGDGALGDTAPFDGVVDIQDLNAVRNNFGATAPTVSLSVYKSTVEAAPIRVAVQATTWRHALDAVFGMWANASPEVPRSPTFSRRTVR